MDFRQHFKYASERFLPKRKFMMKNIWYCKLSKNVLKISTRKIIILKLRIKLHKVLFLLQTTMFRPGRRHKCLSHQISLKESGILVASCIKLLNIVNTRMYVRVSESSKCSFFGKFGVLGFLVTTVLRFAVLPYY